MPKDQFDSIFQSNPEVALPDPAQLVGDLHAMQELLTSLDPGHGTPLPTPRPELTALLGHSGVEAAQNLADIAARAAGFADEDIPQEDLDTTLRPWQLLLDTVGTDGIRLTSAGWLPPAVVVRLREELGFERPYGKGNREEFTVEVKNLRQSATRAGLVRRAKGRLVLTKFGQLCRDSQNELIYAVAQSLVRDDVEFDQDTRVVTLLFVAADWKIGPDSRRAADAAARGVDLSPFDILHSFEDDVAHMLHDIGWQVEGQRPPNADDVRPPVVRVLNRLGAGHGKEFEVPSSPAIRKLARLALFEQ